LREGVRDLNPAYFAVVMATGIVSQAMRLDGAARLSGILLGTGITAYLVLAAANGWRLARFRRQVYADARDPRRAFGFFTIVASSDVLAARLAGDGHSAAAAVLLLTGGFSWLVLSYSLLLLMMSRTGPRRDLADVNATWFLWIVATQSVTVGITALQPASAGVLAVLAVACWGVGVVLYLLIAAMTMLALLASPVRAVELTPAFWVFMGAAAISVLAGARLLMLPASPLLTAAGDNGTRRGMGSARDLGSCFPCHGLGAAAPAHIRRTPAHFMAEYTEVQVSGLGGSDDFKGNDGICRLARSGLQLGSNRQCGAGRVGGSLGILGFHP
jgi:tellurite resistance protein TehA-like permease